MWWWWWWRVDSLCEVQMWLWCLSVAHPRFFNQISQGLDVISVAGEWLTAVTNTNMQVSYYGVLNRPTFDAWYVTSSSQKRSCVTPTRVVLPDHWHEYRFIHSLTNSWVWSVVWMPCGRPGKAARSVILEKTVPYGQGLSKHSVSATHILAYSTQVCTTWNHACQHTTTTIIIII